MYSVSTRTVFLHKKSLVKISLKVRILIDKIHKLSIGVLEITDTIIRTNNISDYIIFDNPSGRNISNKKKINDNQEHINTQQHQ